VDAVELRAMSRVEFIFVAVRAGDMPPGYGADEGKYFRDRCASCRKEIVGCRHCLAAAEEQSGVPVTEYRCFPCAASGDMIPAAVRELIEKATKGERGPRAARILTPWSLN
jgi:hypothetical protein